MIECGKCRAKYPTERLFCGKCRERLGVRCPVCGSVNLLDDIFCGTCLTELRGENHVPHGQESEKADAPSTPLYEEIRMDAEADEAFTNADSKISQEEIEDVFQKIRNHEGTEDAG